MNRHDFQCSGMRVNVLVNFKKSLRAHHSCSWLQAAIEKEDLERNQVTHPGGLVVRKKPSYGAL